jgi:hypothetical protein
MSSLRHRHKSRLNAFVRVGETYIARGGVRLAEGSLVVSFPTITTVFVVSFVVAAIVNMIIGAIWFARPVFGKRWMAGLGKSEAEMQEMMKGAGKSYAVGFLASLLLAAVLTLILAMTSALDSITSALEVSFLVWLGFVLTTGLPSVLFEKRAPSVFGITQGYTFISFLVMGVAIQLVHGAIM